MSKNSYYVSKSKSKKEIMFLELEKLAGYEISPKTHEDGMIGVSKVVFVNPEITKKVIKKKIEKKINYLLNELKNLPDDEGSSGSIKKDLMIAEKLRIQLINNYIKYLGHAYHGLTLKKLDVIIEELRYKLYKIEYKKQMVYENQVNENENVKEGRRGR